MTLNFGERVLVTSRRAAEAKKSACYTAAIVARKNDSGDTRNSAILVGVSDTRRGVCFVPSKFSECRSPRGGSAGDVHRYSESCFGSADEPVLAGPVRVT